MQTYYTGPGIPRQIIPDAVFTQVPPTSTPTPAAANLNYKYYQGGFNVLPDFNALTPVKTGTSSNFDIGIRPPGVNDSFAIVWDGYINIPASGSYTFETISDDGSKLYFNGIQLVNNDSTHPPKSATGTIIIPSPGVYPIKVAYFENYGDQSFQVLWSGPSITRQQIPDTAFVPAGNATTPTNGLNYKFYQGDFTRLPDFSKLTPVQTGVSSNIDIGVRPAGIDDHFAFMWQGFIHLPSAGTYNFETISDDGSRIYFNSDYSFAGFAVVTNDGVHAATSVSAEVTVAAAGIYPIVITYFEKDGGQIMQFNWSGPGISYGPVPDSAFTTTAPPIPPTTGGLSYKYYEKEFSVLPDFSQLTPVKTGLTENVDITVRNPTRNDQFAFLWQGYINIPTAGTYTFETISDDGSKLYFNTMYDPAAVATVNNDGEHPATSVTGTVNVPAAGWYPIAISFFEKNGGESMEVYWSGPGLARQKIPNSAFSQTPSAIVTAPAKTASETVNSVTTDNLTNTRIYPNPFRDGFNIEFYNSSNANNVQVEVYDIRGKLLYLKNAGTVPTGHTMLHVTSNGTILPEGIYIARLQINGVPVKTIKLLKVK